MLPVHDCSLHLWVSEEFDPSYVQLFPPNAGSGLLHFRALDWSPPPHSTAQTLHSSHVPQTPWTSKKKCNISYCIGNFVWKLLNTKQIMGSLLLDIAPGHSNSLHLWVSDDAEPSLVQFVPPNAGSGSSHNRILDWFPPPHNTLQSPQTSHSPHCPFTKKRGETIYICVYIYIMFWKNISIYSIPKINNTSTNTIMQATCPSLGAFWVIFAAWNKIKGFI